MVVGHVLVVFIVVVLFVDVEIVVEVSVVFVLVVEVVFVDVLLLVVPFVVGSRGRLRSLVSSVGLDRANVC